MKEAINLIERYLKGVFYFFSAMLCNAFGLTENNCHTKQDNLNIPP
jgi:hypothetical protein